MLSHAVPLLVGNYPQIPLRSNLPLHKAFASTPIHHPPTLLTLSLSLWSSQNPLLLLGKGLICDTKSDSMATQVWGY